MSDLLIANIGFFVMVLIVVGMFLNHDNSRREREFDALMELLNRIDRTVDKFIAQDKGGDSSYVQRSIDLLHERVDKLSRERE